MKIHSLKQNRGHSYYPIFLDIQGKNCVVIGGGRVAERKVLCLLRAGAKIKLISPALTKRLEKEKSEGRISHIKRKYKKSDLKGAFLVISAASSYEDNKAVADDAKGLLLNVVDTPSLCNFIVPSLVKRGPLQIAVSTSGVSPAMAKTIRKELEALYPPKIGQYLKSLKKKRHMAMKGVEDKSKRQAFLKSLASDEILKRLRAL